MNQVAPMTLEAVLELPLSSREFLEGELFVPPAPEPNHQDSVGNVFMAIKSLLLNRPLGRVFFAPLDVIIEGEASQPDVIFVSNEQLSIIEEKRIVGVPVWLIEVVSPTSHKHDFELKKKFYLEHGVQEYWVVSPEGRVIWVFTPADLEGKVYGAGKLSPSVLPDLQLEVQKVFLS